MTNALRRPAFWLVLLAAGGALAVTMGARQSLALFLNTINSTTGVGLAAVSLAFAIGQLAWGVTQPLAGIAADRWGSGRVLFAGLVLVALGTALVPLVSSVAGLVVAIGILSAGGAGLAGMSVLMAATARLVPPERRGMSSGIVNAGGSFGQFVFVPIAQGATALGGWVTGVWTMSAVVLLALPAAWMLRGKPSGSTPTATAHPALPDATIAQAFRNRSYLLLGAGFFVCGFHVAFVATHLPGVVAACGLSPNVGAWALGIVGLFNIAGSLTAGWAVGRWRMKSLLSLIYAARAVAVVLFLLAPKTEAAVLVFAAVLGFTYLSTVPPTVGLVVKMFGTSRLATLFGFVMLSHQAGGFLGAWLGGTVFATTGSYDAVWLIDIGLAVGAALVHLPIREAPLAPRGAALAT